MYIERLGQANLARVDVWTEVTRLYEGRSILAIVAYGQLFIKVFSGVTGMAHADENPLF
jgi:hypothetical protein